VIITYWPLTSWLPSPLLYSKSGGFHCEGSGYVPADFQADKIHIVLPGPVLVKGRRNKKQALPAPHCETFNGGKGAKTIRQPYYLPNTATAYLFLFQRGEVEAGRPLAVPGRSHE
jgi:hypothetical protein